MGVRIVDTTLRDGEQRAGIALGSGEKLEIAKILEKMGVYQIEAGIPAMEGEEKKSIQKIVQQGLKCKISAWNRMSINDLKHSMDCGVDIIHVSVPASDIQISAKLGKDRPWVLDNMRRCISFARDKGFEVTVGLEDASRADFRYIMQIMAFAFLEGVKRVRYADTVGILQRQRIRRDIKSIRRVLDMGIEFHAHNDLGMATANSIAAAKAGAEYIDCTIGGMGERAGNCDFLQFLGASRECLGFFKELDLDFIKEMQKELSKIIHSRHIPALMRPV